MSSQRLSDRIAAREIDLVLAGIGRETVAEWIAEARRLERPRCDWTQKTQLEHEQEDAAP